MRSNAGLTLVELMVAVVLLAVGILGAVSMQTTSLRATRTAVQATQLTEAVRSELDTQREIFWDEMTTLTLPCLTTMPTGVTSCQIIVKPYTFTNPAVLNCNNTILSTGLAAHYLAVTVTDTQNKSLSLDAVVQYETD